MSPRLDIGQAASATGLHLAALDVREHSGKYQALVAELMASPPSVVERFREAVRSRK